MRDHVLFLATGGTISCCRDSGGALVPTKNSSELLELSRQCREFRCDLEVQTCDLAQLDSSSLDLAQLDKILDTIDHAWENPQTRGIVLSHGTDSLEETALALELFHHDPRPLVITGAMRPADDPLADGPRNLASALTYAADPRNLRQTVKVCFHSRFLAARGVWKKHTTDLDAFYGDEAATTPINYHEILGQRPKLSGIDVRIIHCYPGAPGRIINEAIAAGVDGIVVEAMGAGNVGQPMAEGIIRAREQHIPVVLGTRVPSGPIETIYGGAGGGATLGEAGVISAGRLHPSQARIALIAALAANVDPRLLLTQDS
ncbi:asparaginase [Corynebacterium poyangense]|uniref:Asparaginase n=1 Tax=Corynebacterium poyangense TaxID=2684405 RepID=A0A7H0SQF4_9CORY|nr:asparaginase [Corynebacterium poyangense]MBZ8178336.1 asparaginase [Corynebacterium poyangense]QNQ90779.1 asparaginase [Corynebacterium poyangense]